MKSAARARPNRGAFTPNRGAFTFFCSAQVPVKLKFLKRMSFCLILGEADNSSSYRQRLYPGQIITLDFLVRHMIVGARINGDAIIADRKSTRLNSSHLG